MTTEPYSSRAAPISSARVVIAAIAVAVCVAYLSGGARGIGVAERDRVFSPVDSTDTQLRLAERDVPADGPPTVSNLAGRLSLTVALGRRSALQDLAAVAAALAIAGFGAWLLAIGLPIYVVALSMLGMAAGPMFWGRGISWTYDALCPALALFALWGAARWRATRRKSFLAVAIVLALAAFIDFRLDAVEVESPDSVLVALSEFTPLGAFVMVVGVSTLVVAPPARLLATLLWLVVVMISYAGPQPAFDTIGLAAAIGGWTAFAVGLAWLRNAMSQQAGLALVTAIALIVIGQPVLTRERLAVLGRDLPSEVRTRVAGDIRAADLPDNTAFIAEAHRADVMLRLGLKQSQREAVFVPQIPTDVRAATDRGLTAFAFESARTNLERMGFLFERDWIGNTAVSVVAGQIPCLDLTVDEWQDVTLLVGNGSFVIHGSRPGVAPGGVVVRTSGTQPPQVSSIEPRSIPFDVDATDLRVPATSRTDPVIVTLASAPVRAAATAEVGPPVRMCAGVQPGPLTLGRIAHASASLRMNDAVTFGTGWHPLEADPDFFRWTAAPEALVRVSLAQPDAVRITITATPAARPSQQPTIGLVVNGCRLPVQRMRPGQGDYEWVAEGSCWRSGMNHIWIAVTPLISPAAFFNTHDTRLIGARVGAIQLARQPGS